ncbi:GroES-like protein [Lactarius vividus]|nr:GroES-like protein [Lactarius vividus]
MSPQIPKTQKAAVVVGHDQPIQVRNDYPVKQPEELAPGECLIKLHCTGVCHTDLHARKGDWPLACKIPLVGGHEGVGDIVAIGAHTVDSPVKIGERVGIKWLADSCLQCEQCRKGLEQCCSKCKLSGYTVDGTFSEYVVSYVNHVTPIPESLNSQEAASFLCAGVTVYRALKYSNTKPGDWIVLPGAGGGLGHLAVQYAAHAFGLRVVAVDTGAEKKELVLKLGAEKWIDFRETKDLVKDIQTAAGGEGPHAALVAAASSAAYEQAIEYLRPGGSLMVVGLPADAKLGAPIFWTVAKAINIIGSYVGNRQDAREALEIAALGKVKCHLAVQPLSALSDVYEGMEAGKIVGRVVLNM